MKIYLIGFIFFTLIFFTYGSFVDKRNGMIHKQDLFATYCSIVIGILWFIFIPYFIIEYLKEKKYGK